MTWAKMRSIIFSASVSVTVQMSDPAAELVLGYARVS
jgi:hypothetical protein